MLFLFLPPANEVVGRSVILFTGGCKPPGHTHTPLGRHLPPGDVKRVVRILLECILATTSFAVKVNIALLNSEFKLQPKKLYQFLVWIYLHFYKSSKSLVIGRCILKVCVILSFIIKGRFYSADEISWPPSETLLMLVPTQKVYSFHSQRHNLRYPGKMRHSRSWQRTTPCSCHSYRSCQDGTSLGDLDIRKSLRNVSHDETWMKFLEWDWKLCLRWNFFWVIRAINKLTKIQEYCQYYKKIF